MNWIIQRFCSLNQYMKLRMAIRFLLPLLFVSLLLGGCRSKEDLKASGDKAVGGNSSGADSSSAEALVTKAEAFDANKEEYIKAPTNITFDKESLNNIPNNPEAQLSVPTYITKIDDLYFIVDCYHNRIIYNNNLNSPLYEWYVMTEDINMGHTLASDGEVYLIDDTENNRILVMEKAQNANGDTVFYPISEFNEIGLRPHYIIYDSNSDTFYAWSSLTGEMYLFRKNKDSHDVYLTKILTIPELYSFYVRSFTFIDGHIFLVSGNSNIIEVNPQDLSIVQKYPVLDNIAGMAQITKIEDYYYITISTDKEGSQDAATIIRTKDLNSLAKGEYEDIYSYFEGGGTPYCITQIEDSYYLCEHRLPAHSIWSFKVKDNNIVDVETLY